MERITVKVETGVQLLSRLNLKKTNIENFYPNLFKSSLKTEDVIEVFGNHSCSFLLIDMICEALIPVKLGGQGAQVLLLNTDGHITLQALTMTLQDKFNSRMNSSVEYSNLLKRILDNLFILEIFDAAELNTTLLNLENLFLKHNVLLCVIDTFTAFYWSEQSFKMTKMDHYLKNLLQLVQKVAKGHEMIIIYSRPEYFNSNKGLVDNLEPCCQNSTMGKVNYRIQLLNGDVTSLAKVMTFNSEKTRNFQMVENKLVWI